MKPSTSPAKQSNTQSSLLKVVVLTLSCIASFSVRLFSVIRFGNVIHEFDPYFNLRATKYLSENGFYKFMNWFDDRVWYPLGRHVGETVYPGLMMTSVGIHKLLHSINFNVDIQDVCVYLAPLFSSFTVIATYLLTKEVHSEGAGLFAGAFVAIVPSYISRSVAGSYDYEAVAIFAMIFTYYLWVKAVKTGKILYAVATAFAYFYMASAWGGYVYIINLIPLHVLGLLVTGRFSQRIYVAYSVFYPLATVLSIQVPFIGLKPFTTAEHIGALGVFGLLQLVAIAVYVRSKMPDKNFQVALRSALYGIAGIFAVLFAFAVSTQRISPFTGRLYYLLNPWHVKKNNPLVASVSEHQPAKWSSYYLDLHFLVFTFPIGLYYCFSKLSDAHMFIIIYALTSAYFSGVMVRLMLIVAPAMCVLGGIALSSVLDYSYRNLQETPMKEKVKQPRRRTNVKTTKKDKFEFPFKAELSQVVIAAVGLACLLYLRHCVWAASEIYSNPSIILAGRGANGEQIIFDDFRESYSWLKENTHKDAIVMSWWDYGYQLSALADRITIVDNNTWNNTHIARVGQAMASSEERAYEIANELDVDYVMVVFGGLIGFSSDDINKFLWMVRIGGSTPEGSHIQERDYFNERGEYRVDEQGAPALLNSLAYKLCYYRFGNVYTDYGRPSGYDRVRRTEIGNKNIELKHFEEAYTSKHWMVRIYRVLKPNSHE